MFGDSKDVDESKALHAKILAKLGRSASAAVPAPGAPAPAVTGPCAKAGNVILDLWPGDERGMIEGWYRKEPEEGEQLLSMIDQYVESWKAAARAACGSKNAEHALCLDRIRERAGARIKNAANGTKRSILGRQSLPDFAHCATANETLPPNDGARERIEKGEYYLEYARIMFEIKYWNAVHRGLAQVNDQLRAYNDASIAARAKKLRDELGAADPRVKARAAGSGSGSSPP
jgi:hypothetical protein